MSPFEPEADLRPTSAREVRFNDLFARQVEALRRYAWRRDPQLADDVIAETFAVAWRRLDEIPAGAELPWLIGVARNARLNMVRSSRRQAAVSSRLAETAAPAGDPPGAESAGAVRSALALLSEPDREILLLAAWDELDTASIAGVLGCSKSTVAVRLHRARRRFARALSAPAADPNLSYARGGFHVR